MSRRDDLIQVLYNVLALHNELSPIRKFLGHDPDHIRFQDFKEGATAEEFCKLNQCGFLTDVLTEMYELGYDEEPNYSRLKFNL